jgi:ATP-dependent RNA helicase MSS116
MASRAVQLGPPSNLSSVSPLHQISGVRLLSTAAAKPAKFVTPGAPLDTEANASTRFADLPIDSSLLRALKENFKYEHMTAVQAASVGPAMQGKDVLAKAKTGTGKTLGFLIPSIERVLKTRKAGATGVQVLVLSPTRELAQQTEAEARSLSQFSRPPLSVHCVVGGTNVNAEANRIRSNPPEVYFTRTHFLPFSLT